MKCRKCGGGAALELRRHNAAFCREHFIEFFRKQVAEAVHKHRMFTRDETVMVAVSGGKDSLALWDVLLEEGYRTAGLYLDLGIFEYSVESKAKCEAFAAARGQTLHIERVADAVGAGIPQVQKVTRRPTCSACGLSKRYLMNKAALDHGYPVVATGHNLDDEAATLFGSVLTWQTDALPRQSPALASTHPKLVRRVKPLYRLSELETAGYAFLRGIDYIVEECPFAKGATSIGHKELLNRLEETSPGSKHNFLFGFLEKARPAFERVEHVELLECTSCGQVTTGTLCAFCKLAERVKGHGSRIQHPHGGDTMAHAVIVGAVRTAVGKKGGTLAGVRPDDLLADTLKALVERVKIDAAEVEDVVIGCVDQVGEQGFNIARNAALIAGFPLDVCGTTLDRMCGSGQQAANFAAMGVMAGQYECVIAGGVENMTRVPMGSNGMGPGDGPLSPRLQALYNIIPQGLSAEMIAEQWGLKREELDEFSAGSHEKAGRAIAEGRFKREIAPLTLADGRVFDTDEGVRVPVNREKMAALAPSFKPDGVVTAANSSQISDGAAALLIMSEARAKALGLTPRARIVATALAGVDPTIMLTGPIPATRRVLEKAGMKLEQIDRFEINEAFASVVLAWERELHPDMERVNVSGGAIALGHPLGCSGAKLMTTLLHELERSKKRFGLQTMCIGFGQGIATIIERL